ncbi:MAG: epoxyqueuosine reductase [Chloroflexi bacterium]|nr:epoxyqueuosine reductase [Chloroflexota bacterium]
MNRDNKIVKIINSLFDVAGTSHLFRGDNLLILGLESTIERNLDEFGHSGGHFHMYGFEKHVKHRLHSVLNIIRSEGFRAEPLGRYGYPLEGRINLKTEAIRAGLGKRGKSTIVLHPEYGPRLRLIAIKTDASLEPLTVPPRADEENPVCHGCTICIDACPTGALEPYRMPDPQLCLSNVTPLTSDGHSVLCDMCLHLCPAGRSN